MTSREKFEAWFISRYPRSRNGVSTWDGKEGSDDYISDYARSHWLAWQASRDEAIELPPRKEPTSSGHYDEGYLVASSAGSALDYEDTVDAIRAAGFKVKGG